MINIIIIMAQDIDSYCRSTNQQLITEAVKFNIREHGVWDSASRDSGFKPHCPWARHHNLLPIVMANT